VGSHEPAVGVDDPDRADLGRDQPSVRAAQLDEGDLLRRGSAPTPAKGARFRLARLVDDRPEGSTHERPGDRR
jgi:hypothetical protein